MDKEQSKDHIQEPLSDAESEAMKNDLSGQKTEPNAKLHTFSSEQAGLIGEIVNRIILDAIQGATLDEDDDYLYCEIDYDIINRYMSPLHEMGIDLSVEKLSEFIDTHPAVNYSDYHNTGITVYLNDPEIMQELGYTLPDGMDMDLER